MLWNTPAHRTVKNLALGGGGGLKTEYLFAGALGLIIIGALTLSIYFGVAGRRGKTEEILLHYKCDACGEELTINPAEQPLDMRGIPENKDEMMRRPIDCPKCQAKGSAYRMMKCLAPECAKYFVPESYRTQTGPWGGTDDICPYCGANMRELYHKQIMRRRQQKK